MKNHNNVMNSRTTSLELLDRKVSCWTGETISTISRDNGSVIGRSPVPVPRNPAPTIAVVLHTDTGLSNRVIGEMVDGYILGSAFVPGHGRITGQRERGQVKTIKLIQLTDIVIIVGDINSGNDRVRGVRFMAN